MRRGQDTGERGSTMHHYITHYSTDDGRHFVTSWLQIGCRCFSVRTVEVGAAL